MFSKWWNNLSEWRRDDIKYKGWIVFFALVTIYDVLFTKIAL